jgi:fermentation-respiration switch protein FrsA (DUF1100 family)
MCTPFVAIGWLALLTLGGCTHVFFQPLRPLVISPEQLGLSYHDVYFRSADGTKLHGWFFPAKTPQVKGTFVQFHGNAENISTHFRSLVWVVENGYDLFTFDYRGYGLSEGQVSLEGALDDARGAIVQARMLSTSATGKKLILYGQSLGGTLLLYVAGTMADRHDIAVVIADSAFSSYQAIARETLARHWLTFLFQPLAYVLVSDRHAPQHVLAEISPVALLVIHGDADEIVPVHHGQRIYDRAEAPKWFWKLQGVGHIQAMFPQHSHYRKALLDFLDRLASVSE